MIAGVGVAGAAERRADELVKATAENTWAPSTVQVATGETVTWDLAGAPGVLHNVHGEDGPASDPAWKAFQTDFKDQGQYSYRFTQPGAYEFVCQAHATSMFGTVTVTGEPVTPTPTTSPSPSPSPSATPTTSPRPTAVPTVRPGGTADITTPAPRALASADRTPPAVTNLKLRAVRRGARVSFTVSEPATVTIRFKRGKTVRRTARLAVRAGKRTVTVRGSKLVRGRYTVELEARDARGNRAALQTKRLRVTRS